MAGGAMITLSQTAYGWFADGTENGSVQIAPTTTFLGHDVDSDFNCLLRVRIQESGGAAGATTDDWQLQYNLGGAGWNNVTSSSSVVKGYDSASLTDAGTTTNRLGAGSGSFVAGEISESGLVTDRQITASNFTEMLYSLTVVAADVANGSSIEFRVLYNGATMTYSVTPTLKVYKGNLVTNGTFDTATTGWTPTGGTLSVVTGRLRLTNGTSSQAFVQQAVTTVIGNEYRLLVDVIAGTDYGVIGVGNAEFIPFDSLAGNDPDRTITFTATATTTYVIMYNAGSTTGQYNDFDNVRLVDITPVVVDHQTSGALTAQGSSVTGSASRSSPTVEHGTSGSLTGQIGSVSGSASRTRVHATSGALTGQIGSVAGSAARTRVHGSSGALTGPGATLSGSAARLRAFGSSGVLTGPGSTVEGSATRFRSHTTEGALEGPGSSVAGTAQRNATHGTSGSLEGQGATIDGSAARSDPGFVEHETSGALEGQPGSVTGSAARTRQHTASGSLEGQGSELTGSASRLRAFDAIGALFGQGSELSGDASRSDGPVEHDTVGSLVGAGASVSGEAERIGEFATHETVGELVGAGAEMTATASRSGDPGEYLRNRRRRRIPGYRPPRSPYVRRN
jgi:hypothetical protein